MCAAPKTVAQLHGTLKEAARLHRLLCSDGAPWADVATAMASTEIARAIADLFGDRLPEGVAQHASEDAFYVFSEVRLFLCPACHAVLSFVVECIPST